MTESGWTHLGIIATGVIPLIAIWLDLRHRSNQQHTETRERLTRIETMMEPLWNWWNRTNGKQ